MVYNKNGLGWIWLYLKNRRKNAAVKIDEVYCTYWILCSTYIEKSLGCDTIYIFWNKEPYTTILYDVGRRSNPNQRA